MVNIEKKREYNRKWYQRNKAKAKANTIAWQKNNPERWKEINKRKQQKFARSPKGIYKALIRNSKRKGKDCKMDRDKFIEWYRQQEKKCFYCDISEEKLEIIKSRRLSIDRKDNNGTYRLDNIVLACDWCNSVKGDVLSADEMKKVGQLIIKPKWRNLLFQ